MSVQKKSLINNRAAAKKAMIASQPTEGTESGKKLKASTVKAHTLKANPHIGRTQKSAAVTGPGAVPAPH